MVPHGSEPRAVFFDTRQAPGLALYFALVFPWLSSTRKSVRRWFDSALGHHPQSRRSGVGMDVESLFSDGLHYHLEGRIDSAENLYREVLKKNPKHVNALHHLGLIHLQLGLVSQAIAEIRSSLVLDPSQPDALANLGHCLNIIGDHLGACESCKAALEIDPRNDGAWTNLGNAQRGLKLAADARRSYERALDLHPSNPRYIYNVGLTFFDQEQFEEAGERFQRCLSIQPRVPEAHNNSAVCLLKLQNPLLALHHADTAVQLKPDYAEAWSNRGNALHDLRRHEEALASYDRSIELKPDYAEAWSNRGNTLKELRRHVEALASHDQSIGLKPGYAEAWSNRGNALHDLRRHEEALASYDRSIELKPDCAEAWSNRGNTLNVLRQHVEALASYDRSIELKPDYGDAYWNKSLDLLRIGDFDQGWQLYEWRWRYDKFTSTQRHFSQPLWLGDTPLEGRTLLLHSEQGYGDSIQFCRYTRLVKRLGAKVVLEVEPPLVELFTTLEGVDEVVGKGKMLSDFDYHCPLLSLPLALKTVVATIPHDVPYLHVSRAKREQWTRHLSLSRDKPSVGIVWSGDPKHKNDHNRSICLESMLKFFSDKLDWVCLQRDLLPEDCSLLEAVGIRDHSAKLKDFSDTAGLISQLDLVISVDTSVAHLAGALGKPVWVLLPYVPDYRWMWDREDSPWYPSMRLFRQSTEGDWDKVISRINEELVRIFDV